MTRTVGLRTPKARKPRDCGRRQSICVGYRNEAGAVIDAPTDADSYLGLEPVYEEVPGWTESTLGAQTLEQLPENARAYIRRIEELVGAPVDIISTGPDRNETIVLRKVFQA